MNILFFLLFSLLLKAAKLLKYVFSVSRIHCGKGFTTFGSQLILNNIDYKV